MRNFSMDLMRVCFNFKSCIGTRVLQGKNYSGSGEFINNNVYFRKALIPSAKTKYDLVIVHRTLIEMPSAEDRTKLIELLWQRTNKYSFYGVTHMKLTFRYLVIVESPMYESFKALLKIREHIIDSGHKFDYDYVKNALDLENKLDLELTSFLASKKISDYEKLCKVQDLVSCVFNQQRINNLVG